MLLRRITEHVKDQNWFAVCLDFLIVVVGVFIGIQVANWNEARSEALRETRALAAILEDLREDKKNLKSGLEMAVVNLSATNYILDAAGLESLSEVELPVANPTLLLDKRLKVPMALDIPEPEKTSIWKRITIHYYPAQSDAALGALIAAGNLGLIKEAELVRNLQRYVLAWKALARSNTSTFRVYRDEVVFVGQSLGLSPFTEVGVRTLASLFQENPKLVGAVRTLQEFTLLHHKQIEAIYGQTVELIARIEARLNRSAQ